MKTPIKDTITATQLRKNLDEVLELAASGRRITITHRFKKPVEIRALEDSSTSRTSQLRGLAIFDSAPKKPFPYDTSKPLKALYKESIAKKYGF